jgi:hypothetical protein
MEIAGIPTVTLGFWDQHEYVRIGALTRGCPNLRYVSVPRIGDPVEALDEYYDELIDALTVPLTPEEEAAPTWDTTPPERVWCKCSLLEAQELIQQTTLVENARNNPISKYTDGLPVIIPTEQAVAEMMTGTSHDPDETIKRYSGMEGGEWVLGNDVTWGMLYTSTVEKAAICAVMAGCKPEYMPVVLAIASSGGNATSCPGTSSMQNTYHFVSGPIAEAIGMNPGQNALDVGSPVNMTLGRVGALMSINFGRCTTGEARSDAGNLIHSVCFPEDLGALPEGWIGFNEESTYMSDGERVNYDASESVLGTTGSLWGMMTGAWSFPGYYRSLPAGKGGVARMVGEYNPGTGILNEYTENHNYGSFDGYPGPWNWLDAIAPKIQFVNPQPGGTFWIVHESLAELLVMAGLETKEEVYEYLWLNYFNTAYDWYMTGLWEHAVDFGPGPGGKTWWEILDNGPSDPDYLYHTFGNSPMDNCMIVSDSIADEHWYCSVGLGGGRPRAYPIDPWK